MDTFASIIDGLGGYLKVAEAIGAPPKSVSSMRTRNAVPPDYWPALAQFAAAEGKPEVTVEKLASLRQPRKSRRVAEVATVPVDPAPAAA